MQKLDVEPNTKDSTSEGYEDAICDVDWSNSTCIDLYDIANAAGKLAGNANSGPGALDNFFNKLKTLEQEWFEAERRYQNLKVENDKLFNQLSDERTKCTVYQKKLKFIQDNHKNFERLKQVYLNMKYQESTGRSMVEIREKSSQTQQTIMAPDMYSDKDAKAKLSSIFSMMATESLVSVKKSELAEAQDNLKALKEMVLKREQTWSSAKNRDESYLAEIRKLEQHNTLIMKLLKAKEMEVETLKIIADSNREENPEYLQKIILKMDKRLRDLEKVGKIGRYTAILSDRERKTVMDLVDRYERESRHVRKIPSRGVSPSRANINRTLSAPVPKPPLKQTRPTTSQPGDKKRPTISFKKDNFDDIKELELLTNIKKEIEKKQANLKEKVQEIIDYIEVPSSNPHRNHN